MSCIPPPHGITHFPASMELPLDGFKLWNLLHNQASNCGENIKVSFEPNHSLGHHPHPSHPSHDYNMYNGMNDHRQKMDHGGLHHNEHADKPSCSCPMCPLAGDHQKRLHPGPPGQYSSHNGVLGPAGGPNSSANHPNVQAMSKVPNAVPSTSSGGGFQCCVCQKKIRKTKKQKAAAARHAPGDYHPLCDKCSKSNKNSRNQNGGRSNIQNHGHYGMNNSSLTHHPQPHTSQQSQQQHRNSYSGPLNSSTIESALCAHTCKTCRKSFAFKHDLDRHSKASRGECGKQFKCPKCDKYFSNGGNLKRHAMIHSGEKPYSCSICNKSFRSKTLLSNHIRTHTGEKPFTCWYCDKRFSKSENLKRHTKIHAKHGNI